MLELGLGLFRSLEYCEFCTGWIAILSNLTMIDMAVVGDYFLVDRRSPNRLRL